MRELQYPIGEFEPPARIDQGHIDRWIDDLEAFPADFRALVSKLTPDQLEMPYRPGGWNGRQVVHHVADSHTNSLIRFKWTLTEDHPTIKAYDENAWARLEEYNAVPIETSLDFIEHLHRKMVGLFRTLTSDDLDRSFHHPESGQDVQLRTNVGIYAWHGRHHLAHIESLARREGWL